MLKTEKIIIKFLILVSNCKSWITSLFLKSINSLEDNVRVSKRVNIPSRRLRGFEAGKIGPKDGNQYIGGNYASALNLNSTLPNIFFENTRPLFLN